MRKLLGIAVIACACVLLFAELSEARRGYSYGYRSSSYVRGYTRRDGTYVRDVFKFPTLKTTK